MEKDELTLIQKAEYINIILSFEAIKYDRKINLLWFSTKGMKWYKNKILRVNQKFNAVNKTLNNEMLGVIIKRI